MNKKDRSWIFKTLFVVGLIITLIFSISQTNLFYKNDDFTKNVYFESSTPGDSGSITIKRNENSLSVLDWVTFDNGKDVKFFSKSNVKEKLYFDLPQKLESGVYYVDVEVNFVSGETETKTIKFRVF